MIEEVSVLTTERRRKKPRDVPRPHETAPLTPEQIRAGIVKTSGTSNGTSMGHAAMLEHARVRPSTPPQAVTASG